MTAWGPDRLSALDVSVAELEKAAERLRAGSLAPDEAAELVEHCAELAARVGGELERLSQTTAAEPPASSQETLL